MPSIRAPLISGVTDQIQVRSKSYLLSSYGVGKIFTGVTLGPNIDLNDYVTPGVSRVDTCLNGPPVASPGYLVIHAVNQDEESDNVSYYPTTKGVCRYRQIYYPDSLTESTPYTRVGEASSTSDVVEWSVWTTLGGNWICETLTENKTATINFMYHSFGSWTLTLPDPSSYTVGTRIGLTQWLNEGAVVYDEFTQETTPDLDKSGNVIGALVYCFTIAPDVDGFNIWTLEVDQDISDQLTDMNDDLQDSLDTLNVREAEDVHYLNELITTGYRRAIKTREAVISATFVYDTTDMTNPPEASSNNLAWYDYRVMVLGSGTITLPSITEAGIQVILYLQSGVTTTVIAGDEAEDFTNEYTNHVLVVDLMTVATSASNMATWTVLEVD